MALSMTGYGSGSYTDRLFAIRIELRAVNHRYLEVSFRLPRSLGSYEDRMRRVVAGQVHRGKIDATVHFEASGAGNASVKLDRGLLEGYRKALTDLARQCKLPVRFRLEHLIHLPDLLTIEPASLDEGALWDALSKALADALKELRAMRRAEGEKLAVDLTARLDIIEGHIKLIDQLAPRVPEAYRRQLQKRLSDLYGQPPLDETRLAQEIAVYADRCNITEELVRLRSHLAQLRETLYKDDAVGRRAEFILQEINRETNTIGAKANDLAIAQAVIEIKTELEKIREQIQNLE